MTVYPLSPLARVRQLREDAAAAEYSAREQALVKARQETLARRKALEEYLLWRKEEEDRRYREVLGQVLPRKALDEFKKGIAALREKDSVLMEAVEEARRAEEEAARIRDEAAATLKRCRKDKEKIDAHRELWKADAARETLRLEDLEMEEFSGAKRPEMQEDEESGGGGDD